MLSIYDATITPLKRTLMNLSAILKKGEAYADARNIEHSVLLNARLFPDMYALTRQVQIATDMSKGAAARLSGIEIPKYEDDETTFDELQARITKCIGFLDTIKSSHLEGSESRDVVISVNKSETRDGITKVHKIDLKFTGKDYLLKWVNPNVYFHVTTAYNILRHNGVELGKQDFLGARD